MGKQRAMLFGPMAALVGLATVMTRCCAFVARPISGENPVFYNFETPTSRIPLLLSADNAADSSSDEKKLMDDLGWRAERIRLEEENRRSFLKRKPLKLPYEDARKWIQANLGPNTKEEFNDLVANGNLRTPYIPKRPEEYYRGTKEWISWDHFLHGIFDGDDPCGIRPPSGSFD